MRGRELICTRWTQLQQMSEGSDAFQLDQLVPPGLGWDVDRVEAVAKDIPCGWGTLGRFSCRHRGPALPRWAGPPSQARGEDLTQKSSGRASSHRNTTDPQHSFTCHGLLFVLSTKHFAKEKTEEVEENPRVLVARPPPAAASVHDSKQPHQAIPPLSYLHVFPFLHPSQGCI